MLVRITVWILLGCALFLPGSYAFATETADFVFSAKGVEVIVSTNASFDTSSRVMQERARLMLPYALGVERVTQTPGDKVDLYDGCQQTMNAIVEVNGEKVELPCDDNGHLLLVKKLEEMLGQPILPVNIFRGFTIQLAYLPKGVNPHGEFIRWFNRFNNESLVRLSSIYVFGEGWGAPLARIHDYSDGSHAIRFGVFLSYRQAVKAVRELQLPTLHAQILPLSFDVSEVGVYLQDLGE